MNITKFNLLFDIKIRSGLNTFQNPGKITTQLISKAILQN